MQPEDLIALTAARGVDASKAFEVPGTGPVRWTVAEAGMACAQAERRVYFALLYTFAGDDSCFWELQRELQGFAERLSVYERWRPHLHPEMVASLALCEERSPSKFVDSVHGEDLRRLVLVCPRHVWRQEGQRGYEAVRAEYQRWIADGVLHMVSWLKGRAA